MARGGSGRDWPFSGFARRARGFRVPSQSRHRRPLSDRRRRLPSRVRALRRRRGDLRGDRALRGASRRSAADAPCGFGDCRSCCRAGDVVLAAARRCAAGPFDGVGDCRSACALCALECGVLGLYLAAGLRGGSRFRRGRAFLRRRLGDPREPRLSLLRRRPRLALRPRLVDRARLCRAACRALSDPGALPRA